MYHGEDFASKLALSSCSAVRARLSETAFGKVPDSLVTLMESRIVLLWSWKPVAIRISSTNTRRILGTSSGPYDDGVRLMASFVHFASNANCRMRSVRRQFVEKAALFFQMIASGYKCVCYSPNVFVICRRLRPIASFDAVISSSQNHLRHVLAIKSF